MANTRPQSPHTAIQVACTWSGVVGVTLFFLGLWLPGFIPIPSPLLTPDQVVAMYQENLMAIRASMVLMLISGMFLPPIFAVVSIQLRRIEGATPVLCYTQLCAGAVNIVFFIFTGILFLLTAFRPDRPAEITYMLNDFSWFLAIMIWPPMFTQLIAIAVAILNDKGAEPVFPRWLAFANIWMALLFVPGSLIPFFKTGPFAWNGLLGFWVPATAFGIWFVVMVPMLLKAIKRQAVEAAIV